MPSDIAVAEQQDAIADSLLGEPEQVETADENAGVETADQTEVESPETTEQEQVDAQGADETADDWLPTEQEKVFPDDVLLRYAQRYGFDQLPDDPRQRQLLIDKINSDVLLRQQQEQQQDEPEASFEEEPEQAAEPTPAAPQLTLDQHLGSIREFVQKNNSPEIAHRFYTELLAATGNKLTPDGKSIVGEDGKAIPIDPQVAQNFTNVASTYMLNLMQSYLGHMMQGQLKNYVEQAFPTFGNMYDNAAMANSWESVRANSEAYAQLPAYGTAEFKALADKVADEYPAIADMARQLRASGQFYGKQAQSIYATVAKIAIGQKPDPALVRQAAAAQNRNVRRAQVQRSAATLASGKSQSATQGGAGAPKSSPFQTNQDLFDDVAMSIYNREHGRL